MVLLRIEVVCCLRFRGSYIDVNNKYWVEVDILRITANANDDSKKLHCIWIVYPNNLYQSLMMYQYDGIKSILPQR